MERGGNSGVGRHFYLFQHEKRDCALRSWPYPAQLRDGHGLAGVELSAGRDGHINELARPQVMQYCFRVVGRTHKQFADHADALRVQRMVVLQPTEVDERVTDLLFLLRRHR